MPKITREHWQQVRFIVSSSVLHGDYTGVMSTVCYAGSTCGVNAEAPHAAGGLPRRLEDGVRLWNAARGASRSKWGDDSETSVSCPRKSGIQTWPHVPGFWIPAFAGMTQRQRTSFARRAA